MATILDYKHIENPLIISRSRKYINIKNEWYILIIEIDQNIETLLKIESAPESKAEVLSQLTEQEIKEGIKNGLLLFV